MKILEVFGCVEKGEIGLINYFGSNETVKNLCAYQAYHFIDLFATFTCNQKKHIGVKKLIIGLVL